MDAGRLQAALATAKAGPGEFGHVDLSGGPLRGASAAQLAQVLWLILVTGGNIGRNYGSWFGQNRCQNPISYLRSSLGDGRPCIYLITQRKGFPMTADSLIKNSSGIWY